MPPKRRKRFQGLYYHSSPPKVMPMNGKEGSLNGRKRRDGDDFSVKLSTIRIWMHEKDVGKLTRILWAGQGNRLCQQASNNGRMKRFLAAVPHVMNAIKDVHQAVIDNNLETLQAKLEPPVPSTMVTCKDANGLNIIHKAAGLGHTKILEYIIGIWPEGAHETDVTGKTPLHWAASAKNNMRCYTLLTQAGCDEEALDYKMKTPSYYRHKPHEIERAFLVYVPEAPRVSPDSTTDWEALSTENENGTETKKLDIKLPEANGINGRSVEDSIENTSELDLNDGVSGNEEDVDDLSKDDLSQNLENGKNSSKINKSATPPEMSQEAETNEVNENDNEKDKTEQEEEDHKPNENGEAQNEEENRTSNLNEQGDENKDEEVNMNGDGGGGGDDDDDVNEGNEANEKDAEQNDNDHQVEEVTIEQEEEEEANGNVDKEEEVGTETEVEVEEENEEIKEHENNDENGNDGDDNYDDDEIERAAKNIKENDKTDENNEDEDEEDKDEIMKNKKCKGKQLIHDQETGEKMCIKNETENDENSSSKDYNENHIGNNEANDDHENGHNDDDGEDDDEDVIQNNVSTVNGNSNSNDNNDNDDDNASSPTSSLAIEGFIQGESEDNAVQSQTAAYNDNENENHDHDDDNDNDEISHIKRIISNGDMEQLAEIVLNGDGNKLMDMKSKEPEIQAFLNNVPTYMSKIRRVHDAARDGSLLSLQQALDRRKFAVAKDEISPNGATPLHVAVLFGNSDIVRYLAARFPETMNSIDNNERTALHYAATIKDNGHFYNILVQLGANTKALDKFGHTPDYILSADPSKAGTEDLLNYKQLLKEFGAEELETQLLNDQGQVEHQSFQSNPIFKTEQGKYLADSLADPLIKALTEIANRRPEDPIAYLTGYLQNYMHTRKSKTEAIIHSGSSNTSSTALAHSIRSTTIKKGKNSNSDSNFDNIEIDEQSNEADEDAAQAQQLEERDEHGQSMLHFACARSHRRGGLFTLIEESRADITYRDELYRTARDVALQANQAGNAKEIDRYVLAWAVSGDVKEFEYLALQGYDHVLDVTDDSGKSISDIVAEHGHDKITDFLHNLRSLEESREELHQMIRDNNVTRIQEIVNGSNGKWLIKAKNYYGRTALHIAVLKESMELIELFISICPEALKIADNLERSVLHYAMGTNAIETLSRILIQNGAKRTAKDLKGRQPTYYFMNKADILRLQEEEDENR